MTERQESGQSMPALGVGRGGRLSWEALRCSRGRQWTVGMCMCEARGFCGCVVTALMDARERGGGSKGAREGGGEDEDVTNN